MEKMMHKQRGSAKNPEADKLSNSLSLRNLVDDQIFEALLPTLGAETLNSQKEQKVRKRTVCSVTRPCPKAIEQIIAYFLLSWYHLNVG